MQQTWYELFWKGLELHYHSPMQTYGGAPLSRAKTLEKLDLTVLLVRKTKSDSTGVFLTPKKLKEACKVPDRNFT